MSLRIIGDIGTLMPGMAPVLCHRGIECTCHAERSEASQPWPEEILRGVDPEPSERLSMTPIKRRLDAALEQGLTRVRADAHFGGVPDPKPMLLLRSTYR